MLFNDLTEKIRRVAVRVGQNWAVVLLIATAVSSTGCGLVGRIGGSPHQASPTSQAGIVADERLLFDRAKAPKQQYVKSTRVLPNVDLDLTPEVQDELQRFLTRGYPYPDKGSRDFWSDGQGVGRRRCAS